MWLDELAAFLVALAVASAGTAYVRARAIAAGRIDVPNSRSSHITPTPRGGGLAIVVVVLVVALIATAANMLGTGEGTALLVGGSLVALIGYRDDRDTLAIVPRLAVQLMAAVLTVLLLCKEGCALPRVPALVAIPLLVLAVTWSINLFNFMDGIDGLAASQALFVMLATAGLIAVQHGAGTSALLLPVVTAGACAGFLTWNWPPARIFMGDVGSGFLGYWLAALALVLDHSGVLSVWTTATLMSVFTADATMTLLGRMLRGERWYDAHRSHAYQNLARRWNSHRKVSALLWVINLLFVLPMAALSVVERGRAPQIAVATLAALAGLAWLAGSGRDRPET